MIVLGIDPGYAIVGCGVVEYKNNHFTMLDYGAVTTPAGMPFNIRLERIYDGVSELMEKYKPEAMSIEKLFYNNNAKTVIDVSQARGVLVLAAQKHRIPIFEYTPLQVKQSVVGYGRAEKKQVQEMTRIILNLEKIPKPDDAADALAMAAPRRPLPLQRLRHGQTQPVQIKESSMFYSITGKVVYTDATSVAVSCGGVAFNCSATANTLKNIGTIGDTVTLYTYLNVREDALDMFGFYDKDELDCFKLLINVTGVGPKAALAILSQLPPNMLAVFVASGDTKAITAAQGVGAKLAQRVVLELKDKLKSYISSENREELAAINAAASSSAGEEAVDALVMLGYTKTEAASAVGRLDQSLSSEELIKQALRLISKNI